MQLVRYKSVAGTTHLGVLSEDTLKGHYVTPGIALHDLLRLRACELRRSLEHAAQTSADRHPLASLLAPIDGETEVWAAGVTYKRSVDARVEESQTPDIYTKVYTADRPELFFKGLARRVAGPGQPISIRADSDWNVPEPELAIVLNAYGEIVGYTIANDVSSRSIEGENPLYLPQAKVYAGSCALGPGITPAWEVTDPYTLTIHMTIERNGQAYWEGKTNTGELKRSLDELAKYLFSEDDFPDGVILCTGTALVPEQPFTLQTGDVVHISIDHLGTLSNPVVQGKARFSHCQQE
jgi:2-dehydro-3-deoxy-D-arabinonate dehydratase